MLHLVNGEATRERLRDAQVPGELRSGDDLLMEGPLPPDPESAEAWLRRASWLEARLAIPKADYLAHRARRERTLRQAEREDEIVVWSEADVFCQVNLAYLLSRLAPLAPRVRLVLPPVERLGELDAERLHALFVAREPVGGARVALARRAWDALRADDPRAVAHLLPDLEAWPPMRDALALHLRRFPWTRDGLGLLERALLETARDAPGDFATIYASASRREDVRAYGIGDAQAHGRLAQLARGDAPLAAADDPRALDEPASGGVWRATALGEAVLAGREDAVALRGCDAWLGGVRLEGRDVWRWDDEKGRLVPPGGA